MSASDLHARSASFRSAVSKTVASIWRSARRPRRAYSVRAECERLEERRLLSNAFSFYHAGSSWNAYLDFEFTTGKGTCCEQTHRVHAAAWNTATSGTHGQISVDTSFYSTFPVAFGSGQPDIVASDLSSDGFGKTWGLTRTWSNAAVGGPGNYVVGQGWVVSEMPQLVPDPNSTTTLIVVEDASSQLYFDKDGSGQYHSRQDPSVKLTYVSASNEWVLTDGTGGQTYFHDPFTCLTPRNLRMNAA